MDGWIDFDKWMEQMDGWNGWMKWNNDLMDGLDRSMELINEWMDG